MKKLKKILIPVMLIALYSKVSANYVDYAAAQPVVPPMPKYPVNEATIVFYIIMIIIALFFIGIIWLLNIKIKDNLKKKKVSIIVCLIIGICVLIGLFLNRTNLIFELAFAMN